MTTAGSTGPIRRILLVDDEPSVLFALKLLLQALGFSVHDFDAPEDALKFLESPANECDLVMCDLRMPKLDGHATLTRTKAIRPSLPFILMSGHANNADVRIAEEEGARGFLAKPFSPDNLKRVIEAVELNQSFVRA